MHNAVYQNLLLIFGCSKINWHSAQALVEISGDRAVAATLSVNLEVHSPKKTVQCLDKETLISLKYKVWKKLHLKFDNHAAVPDLEGSPYNFVDNCWDIRALSCVIYYLPIKTENLKNYLAESISPTDV